MTTRKILVATPTAPIAIDVNSSAAVSVTLSGARGANGYGVPVGGDAGAVLAKSASGDYLTSWLTTTAFGRGLLAIADAAGLRSAAGLANVDNTADLSKPVSTAQALAISAAVAAEATIRGSADTSEAGTRAAADTALDGRLDVLEADPITATAVASGLAGKLAIASNLSDLNNATTARNNLGLGSLATQSGTFSGTASGINTGDQTIALTGDVTGSGAGSFAATVAANAITNAKAAQMASNTIKGNNTGATANASDLTAAQVRGVLALPTSTVAGRVALYTDTAGSQGQSSAIFESAGNVGIGTTSPGSKLHISSPDSTNTQLTIAHSGAASSLLRFLDGTTEKGQVTYHSSGYMLLSHREAGVSIANTDLVLKEGNVGIGHTSPRTKLDVVGSVLATRLALNYIDTSNPAQVFIIPDATSTTGALIYSSGAQSVPLAEIRYAGAATNFDLLKIATGNGSTPVLNVGASGNIGIRTTSPRVRLDVAGPVAVGSYTVATVPSAAIGAGQIIYVTNESGGATLASSDGTSWRRMTDRAVIS